MVTGLEKSMIADAACVAVFEEKSHWAGGGRFLMVWMAAMSLLPWLRTDHPGLRGGRLVLGDGVGGTRPVGSGWQWQWPVFASRCNAMPWQMQTTDEYSTLPHSKSLPFCANSLRLSPRRRPAAAQPDRRGLLSPLQPIPKAKSHGIDALIDLCLTASRRFHRKPSPVVCALAVAGTCMYHNLSAVSTLSSSQQLAKLATF